ncbi:MAG TPA: nitroreductase family protein [Clostridiaceae bacterium]
MNFTEIISQRRSIRKYKKASVSEEILQKLYEAIRLAPSGNNDQAFKFIFVKRDDLRDEIVRKACHQDFLYNPPVIMIAYAEKGREFDAAIAVDHMILAATAEGLGTCWVGWFEKDIISKLIPIQEGYEPCILVPIGYADENPAQRTRKTIEELITII